MEDLGTSPRGEQIRFGNGGVVWGHDFRPNLHSRSISLSIAEGQSRVVGRLIHIRSESLEPEYSILTPWIIPEISRETKDLLG